MIRALAFTLLGIILLSACASTDTDIQQISIRVFRSPT
jgi:hypothetical protein